MDATLWLNYEVIVNTYKIKQQVNKYTNLFKSIKLYLFDLFLFVGFLAVGDKKVFANAKN